MSELRFVNSVNPYGLSFHHLGLAVKEPTRAERFLRQLGYEVEAFTFDPLQNVHLAMCYHGQMPSVEIIYPGSGAGPLDRLLAERREGLVYHICYVTNDLDATLEAIESEAEFRLMCVSDPTPAVLFDGRPVSFYVVSGIGLIEIIEQSAAKPII